MKYHAVSTDYSEGDVEYYGADYNYQIVDTAGDIVALFSLETDRDHVLQLLNANPIPE